MSHKIFDNDLVEIRKIKVIMLNKPAYTGMCILELTKVLMYKFHYDHIKSKYGNNSRLLFAHIDNLMYMKKMFDFSNYSTKSNYDNSNKLVVGKMKD